MTAEIHAAAIKNTPTPGWNTGRLYLATLQAAAGNKNVTTHENTRRRVVDGEYIFSFTPALKVSVADEWHSEDTMHPTVNIHHRGYGIRTRYAVD
jgi:hypothetical protein